MGFRRALTALVVAATLAFVAAGSAALGRVHLPRDHYAHPQTGIEWWYATGIVRGEDGHRYSVFYTLFRRMGFVLPISQVVDLGTGALVGQSETLAPAVLGTKKLAVSVPGGRLRYRQRTNTWQFSAADSAGTYALSLRATPQKRYVLHGGGTGVISQSVAGPSAYYSATRMTARGTITKSGTAVRVVGAAWFDHQWGNFVNDPRAFNWDWFSCRFDDRTELMLYRFRDRSGQPLSADRSGTYILRTGKSRVETAFDTIPGERTLDAAGHRWPLDWELRVPAERLDVKITSIVDDQLFRGTLVPTFWEGAATASGTKTGICFVEQTYA